MFLPTQFPSVLYTCDGNCIRTTTHDPANQMLLPGKSLVSGNRSARNRYFGPCEHGQGRKLASISKQLSTFQLSRVDKTLFCRNPCHGLSDSGADGLVQECACTVAEF